LECVFACRTLEDAVAFRDRYRPGSTVYKVRPVDDATPVSTGDYAAISDVRIGPYVDVASEVSTGYWLASQPQSPEMLVGGAVEILAAVA